MGNITDKRVQYNHTTGLFTNKDRTIAFQSYEDADRYNKSLTSSSPGVSPQEIEDFKAPIKTPGVNPKVKPKRVETLSERAERLTHLYDDAPKPKHLDDKSIVDMEKWNSMKGLEKKTPVIKQPNPLDNNGPFSMEVKRQIKDGTYGPGNKKDIVRPKPFKNEDPSTYPMNQKREMNMFEQLLSTVKNPKTKEDREQAQQFKRMIRKDYYNPKMRQWLGDEELKFIGKHPSQRIKKPEVKIPTIDINYKPFKPGPAVPPLAEVIKNSSRVKPGLSEDLYAQVKQINKNVDYVLGKKEERSESENEKSETNKEKTYDR
tara:strand:+ start:426 stop:1376 length:951 start_codon:yes stop_codon:yes gene_type:complete